MENIEHITEIKLALDTYLQTYFENRDLKSTLKLFSSTIKGIGTGLDEKFIGFDECKKFYERDIQQAPNSVTYQITQESIDCPENNVGIAMCELDIQTEILNQKIKMNNMRLSITFVKFNGKWLIEFMHISLPTQVHEEGEAYPIKELEDRNKVLERMVFEKTKELSNAIKEITTLAITDKLTNLYNRLKIDECLNNELNRAQRYDNKFSLVIIDIDNFKKINDTHGHLIGDKFLVEFSEILKNRIRSTDICGRWGGEEFIIIFPETSLESTLVLINQLKEYIENYNFPIVGNKTASFGISIFKKNDTFQNIINRADKALYEAKKLGRNMVVSK